MKLKYIALMLILSTIIISTGSAEMSPAVHRIPGNLHEMIYLQYRDAPYYEELHEGSTDPQNPFQGNPNPHNPYFDDPERSPYTGMPEMDLERATLMLDENIKKAEMISTRLEGGIRQLREDGKDVSKLEALLEEYNGLMGEAKQYRKLADEAYDSVDNGTALSENLQNPVNAEKTGRDYLIGSQKKMMAANRVLENMFREFHHVTPGTEELDETEKLTAQGSGVAVLSGSFRLEMHLENTGLIIKEMTPDSAIYIKGDYEIEEISEMGRKVPAYIISSADVEITGTHKTVMLKSENISLTVREGWGYTSLFGNGTYSIENEEGLKQEKNWGGFFPEAPPDIGQGPEMIKPGTMGHIGLRPDTSEPEKNPEKKPENNPKQ